MSAMVAFIRGINVGGNCRVPMAELRTRMLDDGFAQVKTLLNSGNVVFAGRGSTGSFEKRLNRLLVDWLELDAAVMVRTLEELEGTLAAHPFDSLKRRDDLTCYVAFSKTEATDAEGLKSHDKGYECVGTSGRESFLLSWPVNGRTALPPAVLNKHLGVTTLRNLNTVIKCRDAMLDLGSVHKSAPRKRSR